ncbi:hypothetical protein [Streptomyces sp. NPDC051452]|uniref:hypothetical protein n=1 Tax=Streptomyces sp. NPDC051452 TaxID=3365654 RepID=UPI0037AC42B8
MSKVKMTAKPRTKAIAPPLQLTEAVKDGLERLGDPLGDVLALLDQSRLSDLLNRMGKTRRTRLLQRLHVPAMGRLTPTVCSHALTQLHASRPPAQRLQDAETLGSPLFESLAQARAEWLEGRRSGALEESLEQAPRDELLLAAIAFWDADPSQTHVLAWTLQNRALPSWPAKEVETLARSCARLATEWGALYAVDGLSPAEAATDRATPGAGWLGIVLDSARQCDDAAERLEALLEQATGSARQAWESLGRRVLPDSDAWEPVQALHAMAGALVSALTAIDPANGSSFEVSVRLDSLMTALRHRGDELREREELSSGLARVLHVVTSQPHAAIDSLRAQADRLAGQATWSEEDINLARLLTDVVALSDAVHRDDDLGVERLDERLRGALPEELRAVVLLVVRGKASFPADADMDRTLPAPRAPAASITLAEHESVDPVLPATRGVSRDSPEADDPLGLGNATGTADPAAIEPLVSDLHEVPTPEGSTTLENDGATRGMPATVDAQDSLSQEKEPDRSHTVRVSDAAQATAFEAPPQAPPAIPQQQPSTPAPASKDESSTPSIILECLGQHEIALAYHAAQANGFGELASTLRLFVLAETMRSATGACTGTFLNESATRLTEPDKGLGSADLLLRAAAFLRVCLVCGDPGVGEALRFIADYFQGMPTLHSMLTTVAEVCARGQLTAQTFGQEMSRPGHENDPNVDVTSVSALARGSLAEPRTLHFPRANEIVRAWWAEDGSIGSLLHAAAEDDRTRLDTVRSQLLALRKPEALGKLLSKTDTALKGKSSSRLQGAARRRILHYAQESLEIVNEWLTSVQNSAPVAPPPIFSHLAARLAPLATDLATEIRALGDTPESPPDTLLPTAAHLALASVRGSIALLSTGQLAGPESAPNIALNVDLLRCTDLEFDAELTPLRAVTSDDVSKARVTSWETAARDHASAENYATARTSLEMFELQGGRSEVVSKLRGEHHRLRAVSRREVEALSLTVRHRAETAARLGQLEEPGRSRVSARLEAVKRNIGGDNLGTVRRECTEILGQLDIQRDEERSKFQAKATQLLNNSDASASMADKIRALISQGDLATAEEFLLAVRERNEPPTVEPATDFDAFFPTVCDALESGITPELIREAGNGGTHRGLDFSALTPAQRSQTADALTALQQLHTQWNTFRTRKHHLKLTMRLAGIEYIDETDAGLTGPATRRWFDITDVKLVGPCRLPQFGSGSDGRLRVMTTRSVSDARTLLGWIEQDVSQLPVLVVVTGSLGVAQRQALARECVSRRDKPVLVLDASALAFLAARGTGLFATTERVLAPFSAVTPYFPEASDTLPAEMFYGRSDELSAVLDSQGSSILYGGRRLGKSALLKAAAARYRRTRHHVSLYIPLPSGMGLTPGDIWDLLARSLHQSGIAERRAHRASTMHQVEEDVDRWLQHDKARKLLILFDECDEFFDGDARENFVHTTALRNLMSSSGRRFKPVFAGLHQVQRFASLPNQPLAGAHFGEPLVIGPLSPGAAYRLLHDPMQVLGIRFESDTLIHRALAYANYHPKIIQHIGLALVLETHSRRTLAEGPPWTIDEETLERVIGSTSLVKSIRDTVRLTLHLDPRYKLIALALALHAYRHGVDQPIAGRELRTECAEWWPKTLSVTPPDEYRALLEEMAGLGVLAADDSGWRLRSSNVLRLLGSPASIEEELSSQEGEAVTALSAAHSRRPLPGGLISPLTEAQIADLTRRRNGLRIVIGTRAAGLEDVEAALTGQQERVTSIAPLIIPSSPKDYRKELQAGRPGRQHRIIVSDTRGFGPSALRQSLDQALTLQPPEGVSRCVVALLDPSQMDHLRELTNADEENIVLLQLTTADGLRSWTSSEDPMTPYYEPTQRAALLEATGGWPIVLNHLLTLAVKGYTPRKALAQLKDEIKASEGVRLLEATGLTEVVALHPLMHQLVAEFDAPLPLDDLHELLHPDYPNIHFLLTTLRRMNVLVNADAQGLAVEPILAAAWRHHGPH